MANRIVDCVQICRRFRSSDGSPGEVPTIAHAVRSEGAGDLLLWVSGDIITSAPAGRSVDMAVEAEGPAGAELESSPVETVVLDFEWRVSRVLGEVDELLGHSPEELNGEPFLDLVHPGDRAALLLALARSTAVPRVGQRLLRLRHRSGAWQVVGVTPIARPGGDVPQFSLTLRQDLAPGSPAVLDASSIDAIIRRFALELQAAGVTMRTTAASEIRASPMLANLSLRQKEVASRLLRGERVPRIAKAMFVSESTIRSHLTAIFRTFGVHSQDELLARLRSAFSDPQS
jgi:PAS domain S-box-containing protein